MFSTVPRSASQNPQEFLSVSKSGLRISSARVFRRYSYRFAIGEIDSAYIKQRYSYRFAIERINSIRVFRRYSYRKAIDEIDSFCGKRNGSVKC